MLRIERLIKEVSSEKERTGYERDKNLERIK